MNKSQFANFANIIQLSDLKLSAAGNSELKKDLKNACNPKRRETVKERLAGWNDGPHHLQPRRSVLETGEMSPIKVRSKASGQKLGQSCTKPVSKAEFKTLKTELDLSPLRAAAARKPKTSFDLTKEIPSFIIHETELDF